MEALDDSLWSVLDNGAWWNIFLNLIKPYRLVSLSTAAGMKLHSFSSFVELAAHCPFGIIILKFFSEAEKNPSSSTPASLKQLLWLSIVITITHSEIALFMQPELLVNGFRDMMAFLCHHQTFSDGSTIGWARVYWTDLTSKISHRLSALFYFTNCRWVGLGVAEKHPPTHTISLEQIPPHQGSVPLWERGWTPQDSFLEMDVSLGHFAQDKNLTQLCHLAIISKTEWMF